MGKQIFKCIANIVDRYQILYLDFIFALRGELICQLLSFYLFQENYLQCYNSYIEITKHGYLHILIRKKKLYESTKRILIFIVLEVNSIFFSFYINILI